MQCKHCLYLDCCNMNEPQRILVKQNFPKLRPLLAIERSYATIIGFVKKRATWPLDIAITRTARSKKAEAEASKQGTDRIGFLAYHQKTAI